MLGHSSITPAPPPGLGSPLPTVAEPSRRQHRHHHRHHHHHHHRSLSQTDGCDLGMSSCASALVSDTAAIYDCDHDHQLCGPPSSSGLLSSDSESPALPWPKLTSETPLSPLLGAEKTVVGQCQGASSSLLHRRPPQLPNPRRPLASVVTRPRPVKHFEREELDLVSLKGEQLCSRTLELLHMLEVKDWADVVDHRQINLARISGAMTNCVFVVTGPPITDSTIIDPAATQAPAEPSQRARKVLLRVYGHGVELLFSREHELHWLRNLSMVNIGPSLLGTFKNGRFEEYVESTTLTKEDLQDPATSRHIAHRMCELHNIVNLFPPEDQDSEVVPQTQGNIKKWAPLAREAIRKIHEQDPAKHAILAEIDFERLLIEVSEVQRELEQIYSPLVLAHNDAQYGNILRSKGDAGELVVIDFEYAGYNSRGFDIGNHFCEWMADYHSDRPSIVHRDRYPTKIEQFNFLEAYLEAELTISGYHLSAIDPSDPVLESELMDSMGRAHLFSGSPSKGLDTVQARRTKRLRSFTSAIASGLTRAAAAVLPRRHGAVRKTRTASLTTLPTPSDVLPGVNQIQSMVEYNDTVNLWKDAEPISEKAFRDTAGTETLLLQKEPVVIRTKRRDSNASEEGLTGQQQLKSMFVATGHALEAAALRDPTTRARALEGLYKEANAHALMSHVMWGHWGLIQAIQSEIEFDYLEYALERVSEFRRRRDEFLAL